VETQLHLTVLATVPAPPSLLGVTAIRDLSVADVLSRENGLTSGNQTPPVENAEIHASRPLPLVVVHDRSCGIDRNGCGVSKFNNLEEIVLVRGWFAAAAFSSALVRPLACTMAIRLFALRTRSMSDIGIYRQLTFLNVANSLALIDLPSRSA
jgi:hypothetical protein